MNMLLISTLNTTTNYIGILNSTYYYLIILRANVLDPIRVGDSSGKYFKIVILRRIFIYNIIIKN